LFHEKRHPAEMGETEIAAFLSHLAINESRARIRAANRGKQKRLSVSGEAFVTKRRCA
jgi:hypothetical protein